MLKPATNKLPKSKVSKEQEQEPKKIRRKKIDDYTPTPRKRAIPKPKLTEEQLKEVRSKAAKKAAKTRKENESKLAPVDRELLRLKRGDRARKNFSKISQEDRQNAAKKGAEKRKQFGKHKAYDHNGDYASKSDAVIDTILRFIDMYRNDNGGYDMTGRKYSSKVRSVFFAKQRAALLFESVLNEQLAKEDGKAKLVKRIEESGVDIGYLIDVISYSSDEEEIATITNRIFEVIKDSIMNVVESEILADMMDSFYIYNTGDEYGEY